MEGRGKVQGVRQKEMLKACPVLGDHSSAGIPSFLEIVEDALWMFHDHFYLVLKFKHLST